MKKFIITESEKNDIRKMYGLIKEQVADTPNCSNAGCSGTYTGPEFQGGSDVAHQYSNTITKAVANKLKELYKSGSYVKVDFSGIKLSTKGMGSGNVVYSVTIPFMKVNDKCEARTGFAHVGGWKHEGAGVSTRKSEIYDDTINDQNGNEIRTNPVVGTINDMESSKRTSTPEGLVEYWIQWKHSNYQSDCGKTNNQQPNQQTGPISLTGVDLNNFKDDIKSTTSGRTLDLSTIKLDMDNLTFSVQPGKTPIFEFRLRWNKPNEKTCESCDNTVTKNQDYSAKSVKSGNFENNTRMYSLIALYPKQ